jgi:heat shock protein HslJ
VNLYFGSFETLPGDGIRWHRAGIGSTMMAGPLELMELERVYFSALMESGRLSLEGGGMIMQSADGRTQLKFARLSSDQPVAQHFDKPLELVRLIVSGEEISLPPTGRPGMTISEPGLVKGFAGVNQFLGTVRIRPDGSVLPGPFASTRKAGPPELMAVEDGFLRAFGLVRKARSAESGLTFTSEDSSYSLEFETR